jgi:hypothetical protein
MAMCVVEQSEQYAESFVARQAVLSCSLCGGYIFARCFQSCAQLTPRHGRQPNETGGKLTHTNFFRPANNNLIWGAVGAHGFD